MSDKYESPEQQIQVLQQLRITSAAMGQTLAERELAERLLRAELELEARNAGITKTEAEKVAKVEPRYLDHVRRSIQLSYERAVTDAEAEATAYRIRLALLPVEAP
jgi:hypothetical protein